MKLTEWPGWAVGGAGRGLPVPELTRVHIVLKGKIVDNLFKRVRGKVRVSSGGAAGSVRLSSEIFFVFCSFSLCLTKCVKRARVRGMSSVVLRVICGACAWRRPRQLRCLFSSLRVS